MIIDVSTTSAALHLAGDLDIYGVADLRRQLLSVLDDGQAIELDLGAVTTLDSAGVQQLLALQRECIVLGRPLRVSALSEPVREVIELFGLRPTFPSTTDAR